MSTFHDPITFEVLHANVRLLAENERLEMERQRLLELDKLKTEFLARVSHDLRTPLNSIIGFSELMLADNDSKTPSENSRKAIKQNDNFIEAINRNGHSLLVMINDLLDLSTIESGQMVMHRDWVPLTTIIKDLRAATMPIIDARKIQVSWPNETALVDSVAFVDRRRLGQALINLMDNARKFTPVGGRITVEMESSAQESRFAISDDGPGVPPDEQERIFRPYYQRSGSSNAGVGGVGLGLAIVKSIIERHGGGVGLDSRIGKGCRFHMVIPHSFDTAKSKAS